MLILAGDALVWALAGMLKGELETAVWHHLPTAHLTEFDLGYAERAKVSYN